MVDGHLKWHWLRRQCRFRWLGRLGEKTNKLKDARGLVQNLQAFMFGAIEEDVLTQHPATQEAATCPKTDAEVSLPWLFFNSQEHVVQQ